MDQAGTMLHDTNARTLGGISGTTIEGLSIVEDLEHAMSRPIKQQGDAEQARLAMTDGVAHRLLGESEEVT